MKNNRKNRLLRVICCAGAVSISAACYGTEERAHYSLLLQVTAQFNDDKYNDTATLRSISELNLFAPSTRANEPKIKGISRLLTRTESDSRKLQWIAEIVLEQEPAADLPLTFTLGSRSERILVGKRKWQEYKNEHGATDRSWYRAQAKVDLQLTPPDWPVIQSVRLLPATEPLTSIVEAVVQNYGSQPLALDQIVLYGRHPRKSGAMCGYGDVPQEVILNWEKIVGNEVSPASTNLHSVNIQVPVTYNGAGECSPYSFNALIPIDWVVPSNEITRVQLLIKELPTMRRSDLRLKGVVNSKIPKLFLAPNGLVDWSQLKIAVNPSEHSRAVFPNNVDVDRK